MCVWDAHWHRPLKTLYQANCTPFFGISEALKARASRKAHIHSGAVGKADGTDAAYYCFVARTSIVRAGRAHQLVSRARSDSAQAQDALQIAATSGRAASNSAGSGADH